MPSPAGSALNGREDPWRRALDARGFPRVPLSLRWTGPEAPTGEPASRRETVPSSNSKLRALDRRPAADHGAIPDGDWLVLVCVRGSFRIVTAGEPVAFRGRGKAEALLSRLAIERERGVARESLLDTLWPDSDLDLAGQSLNTLVY